MSNDSKQSQDKDFRHNNDMKCQNEGEETLDDTQSADEELNSSTDEGNEELTDIEILKQKLADAEANVEKEKKEYLFLMAEFDNFRKRTGKEKSDIIKNASENVLKGLLPIVDDFERGLEASANVDDSASIRQGMELIYHKLLKFLAQNGVKPIESTGQQFDAELHEAIAIVPTDDETKKGVVIDTPTKGYTINDKVLRHAKVVVGQ